MEKNFKILLVLVVVMAALVVSAGIGYQSMTGASIFWTSPYSHSWMHSFHAPAEGTCYCHRGTYAEIEGAIDGGITSEGTTAEPGDVIKIGDYLTYEGCINTCTERGFSRHHWTERDW